MAQTIVSQDRRMPTYLLYIGMKQGICFICQKYVNIIDISEKIFCWEYHKGTTCAPTAGTTHVYRSN